MAGQDQVAAAFQAAHDRRMAASRALLNSYAQEMGNWMSANARWVDRTANARNSLEGITEFTDDTLKVIAKGGGPPDYVEYLETAMAGKYAIIRPCLEHFAGLIIRDLKAIWS
jgi:hypothetical protein